MSIVNNFGLVKVVKKEWNDDYKENYPEYYQLNLENIKTWSTYDHTCIDLYFQIKDELLYCNVTIYNGDSFSGHRKTVRFSAELIIQKEFLYHIEDKIHWAFDNYLDDEYDKHLLEQRKTFIANLRGKILKND